MNTVNYKALMEYTTFLRRNYYNFDMTPEILLNTEIGIMPFTINIYRNIMKYTDVIRYK